MGRAVAQVSRVSGWGPGQAGPERWAGELSPRLPSWKVPSGSVLGHPIRGHARVLARSPPTAPVPVVTSQPPRSFCVSYSAVRTVGAVTSGYLTYVTQRRPRASRCEEVLSLPRVFTLIYIYTDSLILDFSVGYAPLLSLFSSTFKGMSQIWPGRGGRARDVHGRCVTLWPQDTAVSRVLTTSSQAWRLTSGKDVLLH